MKKIIICLLATLGLTSACGQAKDQREQSRMNSSFTESRSSSSEAQQNFENADVMGFSELIKDSGVVLLDVRTAAEYAEGHIEGAILIDQGQSDFVEKVKAAIPTNKKVAVYCRSGRRSANAAGKLADIGYKCVNLNGGIMAWKEVEMPVTTETYEVDVFKTKSGKTIKFHALVHASIRIQYDGKEIEIDPVTKLGEKTIDYAAMPKADYLFVTHAHGDHFNQEAIKLLSKEKTRFITNKRCADMYGAGEVMANGDKIRIADDFTIEAVPAYNITEGHTKFHPKGRDNGYILTIDGLRIYIAGDTEDIPEMESIRDIDIAFLPCNQPYTMTTEQLVRAAKITKPKVLFPYHYGQTDVSVVPSLLESDGIDVRIRHYE
jgi:L-ascorbate metabolism protein UlaG (beta-lactamase superfamily)/rhodanese-related sulfurtransferase